MRRALTAAERVLFIAALSSADPRTVRKALRGEQVRGSVAARIQNALSQLAELEAVIPRSS
jgi:hypothetical protein